MGIFKFLNKKHDKANKMDFAVKSEKEVEEQEEFVSDISMCELDNVDWSEFGSILKQNGVLSNSYIKQPADVEISLDKSNRPKVILEFKSKTSNSVRKVELLQDKAYLFVNGALEMYPETQRNKDLNRLWKDYQNRIRYYNMIETNREGYTHVRRGARMLVEAQKMMNMKDIYDREQEFLEKYQNTKFDGFYSASLWVDDGDYKQFMEMPQFVPLKEIEDGKFIDGKPVLPFTPKTLEHCILHMTNGQKIEDGEYLDEFEKKCRKIQKYSCFESEDWDKVIEFGKNIVRNKYIVAMLSHEKEM